MFDLRTIMEMNKVPEINPDRMGFAICETLDEKTAEIREVLNTLQGMMPIDSDHNAESTISIVRKLRVAILTLIVHMKMGATDKAFLKDLEVEIRDLAHESNIQLDSIQGKLESK